MDSDLLFHLFFVGTLVLVMSYRLFQHYRAGSFRERPSTAAEGKVIGLLRIFVGIPFLVLMLGYTVYPPAFAWATVSLPVWLRWCGVALTVGSVPLLFWIHRHLGKNFSTTLRVRTDHTLVTTGPYHWVRHPMYTLFVLMFTAFFLLTTNWLFGLVPLAMLFVVMVWRTPREERQLREKFGSAYDEYVRRTGRYLPRLARAPG